MQQALRIARPDSIVGFVGVHHGMEFDGQSLFFAQVGLLGGSAPVRLFAIDPGNDGDCTWPSAPSAL